MAAPPVHSPAVPSGHSAGTSDVSPVTSGCSGETTMKVAPKSVSGRVVNTVRGSSSPGTVKSTQAPSERPIQLRCMRRTFSGQSMVSRSAISRSA